MKRTVLARAVLLTAICSGCTHYAEDPATFEELAAPEDVGVEQAAIGEASCKLAAPNLTSNKPDVYVTTYDHPSCREAFVVQADNFVSGNDKYFHVSYVGVKPANQIVCTTTYARMDVYKLVNGSFELQKGNITQFGIWMPYTNTCAMPIAHYRVPSTGTYKITMQAKRDAVGTSHAEAALSHHALARRGARGLASRRR
jgi:hypothetical protein